MISKKYDQKGMSVIEAMTACCILALSVIVFMTLQSQQEIRFTQLRKFDKAAYAVDLMFEELSAVYNPVPVQYGDPIVDQNTSPSNQLLISGCTSLPDVGDKFMIAGVSGSYQIIARTSLVSTKTTLTIERSDIPQDSLNLNLASTATANAKITFVFNSNGSLEQYNNLDLLKYNNTTYQNTFPSDVKVNLVKWGSILNKHLGRPTINDKRKIEVIDVTVNIPIDENQDGITDQIDGIDQFVTSIKTQVTVRIKQDKSEEIFRRHYTNGT
jgi:hypothetical protein|tara:strand:+ start:273 stop:1082 length:810 start_codon:yes stop_codon:yes gene_type:complete